MLILLADGCPYNEDLFRRLVDASMNESEEWCTWFDDFKSKNRMGNKAKIKGVVYRVASDLRKKFKKAGFVDAVSLIPSPGRAVTFPTNHIKWQNREKFADICGCLLPSIGEQEVL